MINNLDFVGRTVAYLDFVVRKTFYLAFVVGIVVAVGAVVVVLGAVEMGYSQTYIVADWNVDFVLKKKQN